MNREDGATDHPAAPRPGTGSAPAGGSARRVDPGRRDRIIEACLDVIAADGVAGTSHRKVAAAAGVPLGSMTYHFSGIDDLLREAFTRFAARVADGFDRRMAEAADLAAARRAVAALVVEDVFAERRDLAVTLELYTLAARKPVYRAITDAWMARSRAALGHHFDPGTTARLDALIEGLTIHRALRLRPPEDAGGATELATVLEAVDAITTGSVRPELAPRPVAERVRRRFRGRAAGN